MTRLRWVAPLVLLAIAVLAGCLWWVRPKKVDMAIYAPANSLLYVEANHPLAVADTITNTDVWKIIIRPRQPNLERTRTIGCRALLLSQE
jgi:hypothetical protein